MTSRPGLAKGRRVPLVTLSSGARVRTSDSRWREAFDAADAVSEGAARVEGAKSVWYGSTSLILPVEATSDAERAFLAAVAERDVHVRTRAIRAAVREAAVRVAAQTGQGAGSRLGRSQCEIRFSVDPGGVRIDVDVQAPLIEGSATASRRGTRL
jgi:hypothetical protein